MALDVNDPETKKALDAMADFFKERARHAYRRGQEDMRARAVDLIETTKHAAGVEVLKGFIKWLPIRDEEQTR